jgi:hypothetical protein
MPRTVLQEDASLTELASELTHQVKLITGSERYIDSMAKSLDRDVNLLERRQRSKTKALFLVEILAKKLKAIEDYEI